MVGPAIVVGVLLVLNMITSLRTLAVEAVKRQTFNCCACPVTVVSRTAAPAKYTSEQLEPIAVMEAQRSNQQRPHVNVPALLRKELGVKTKQRIPVDVATFTNIQQTGTK